MSAVRSTRNRHPPRLPEPISPRLWWSPPCPVEPCRPDSSRGNPTAAAASMAARTTPIDATMKSPRRPMSSVWTNRPAEGASRDRASGSKKSRSACWITTNRIHQKRSVCRNDQTEVERTVAPLDMQNRQGLPVGLDRVHVRGHLVHRNAVQTIPVGTGFVDAHLAGRHIRSQDDTAAERSPPNGRLVATGIKQAHGGNA